jgi:hypothetical protein
VQNCLSETQNCLSEKVINRRYFSKNKPKRRFIKNLRFCRRKRNIFTQVSTKNGDNHAVRKRKNRLKSHRLI